MSKNQTILSKGFIQNLVDKNEFVLKSDLPLKEELEKVLPCESLFVIKI